MTVKRSLHALALSFFGSMAAACSPLSLLAQFVPETGYQRTEGISYGLSDRQKLDVYRPDGSVEPKAVIVFFYGGSWKSGKRQDYRFIGQALASRGYLVVVPDYRLYPEVGFPDFVEDAADAIAWVHREIGRFGGDPGKIVIAGHSAGAHIAALVALDPSYLQRSGLRTCAVAGMIGLAGPYGFDPLKYSGIRPIFADVGNPDRARPVTFAGSGAPPALLIHGEADWTVSDRNSAELARRLTNAGAQVRYVPLENVGHSGILLALSSPFSRYAPVIDQIVAFMDRLEQRRAPVCEQANP